MVLENACPEESVCHLKGLVAENQVKHKIYAYKSKINMHRQQIECVSQNNAWLDGNPETGHWCFAAGTSVHWPAGSNAFPGFCDSNNGNGHHAASVYFMELYTNIPEL